MYIFFKDLYIHTYTYIVTYIPTYLHTYMHAYIHVNMYTSVCRGKLLYLICYDHHVGQEHVNNVSLIIADGAIGTTEKIKL